MKIAICGFGLEGKTNLRYFSRIFPHAKFTVFDEKILENFDENSAKIENVEFIFDENIFEKIDESFDLILRSPSISPKKFSRNLRENSEKLGFFEFSDKISRTKIWSATNEFFAQITQKNEKNAKENRENSHENSIKIIGITGTKGKGTVATMARDILREYFSEKSAIDVKTPKRQIHLLGNIGIPSLEILPKIRENDIVIFELSSFQLWDLEFSPHIAVVLRIEADHLDVHENFADYVSAKSNIARFQTANDAIIFYEKNQFSREIALLSKGEKIPYPAEIHFDETVLTANVAGAHYIENAKAAIAATRVISPEIPLEIIEKGLANFRAMPHRLEFIREFHGVKFYDDNFSASFPSLDVAVKAFPKNPVILIAGGFDRDLNNYAQIAKSIENSTVKFAILIGQTAPKIAAKLTIEHKICSDLAEVFSLIREISRAGDIVVMSPGAPSFDMWKNFYERGEEFQKLTKGLR